LVRHHYTDTVARRDCQEIY